MQLFWDGLTGAAKLLVEGDPLVLSAAWRSLWISTLAVVLASGLGIPIGAILSRCNLLGCGVLVVLFRSAMSLPTVLIGLLCYATFSRQGPLGALELLYSPWVIVIGEICLALPIIVTWTYGSIADLDPRVEETARTLGAGWWRCLRTSISEARLAIILAVLTAFSRCIAELGVAMMVGGNIKHHTRTLTTATALETARGEFDRGVAMSLVLLALSMLVTIPIAWLARQQKER